MRTRPAPAAGGRAAPKSEHAAESEVRLRAILASAVDGIITINDHGIIESLNPAAQALFGYSEDELIGANVKILMPEPYRSEHDQYLRNYRQTGRRRIIGIGREVTGRRKNGSVFPLDLAVSEFEIRGRRLFTGIVRDVTERKRVEEERQKFVSLVENSSDAIAMASLDWQFLYVNRAGQQLLGVDPGRVSEIEVRDLWDDSTLSVLLAEALPAQSRGESFRFQGRVKNRATGETVDVDCNTFAILDPEAGRPLAIAFSLRDIREQKRSEQALRDSEARMKGIFDSAVDGIVTISERGIIETVNPAAEAIFGYAAAELIGENVKILMPPPYREEHDQYLRNYRHTNQRKIIGIGREVVGRRKDGSEFPLDLSVSEVLLGDRRLFTGLIRDITERKQAEAHRNLLMAELSHRVKNTLATVLSIAQRSFHDVSNIDEARASFEGRIRALAQTHNRLAETNWAGTDLRGLIADEVLPYHGSRNEGVVLDGPDLRLTPKSAIILGIAFHELATNAAKHGALSRAEGGVEVTWQLRPCGGQLVIRWTEAGGPAVAPPTRQGFGRFLLERGVAEELRGTVELGFNPEGLTCVMALPAEQCVATPAGTGSA